jgi:uncharacterized membrane protein YraQ (UPF0718 family)
MGIGTGLVSLLQGGLGNLAAYLAAHVLLCLLPAFFIAGGLAALVPKEAVTRFLGRSAPIYVAYPVAALAGSVLAVCSCTVVPLFAGIYRRGGGLGPAITFLFFAPAANILAISYTGVALGMDLAIARILLSLVFGIGIGMIMALIYSKDEAVRNGGESEAFAGANKVPAKIWIFMLLLVALLLFGTFKIGVLTASYGQISLPIAGIERFQALLNQVVPFDASKGEEGLTVQGVILIALLGLIGLTAWFGLDKVYEGFNRWTWACLGLIVLTLVIAATRMVPQAGGLQVQFTGRVFAVALSIAGVGYMARTRFEEHEIQGWLWEAWRLVKQIFPLLVVGVFAVGVIRPLIRPEWIQYVAGTNSLLGGLAGVLFGVFMYFPTLVEVPIAKMFLGLGMHRGPLLAYLMADPELSLQSILMLGAIIGRSRAVVYAAWVGLFSLFAGWLYGLWVDGTSALVIGALLLGFVGLLALGLWFAHRRTGREVASATAPTR